jgi:hypothetical protein
MIGESSCVRGKAVRWRENIERMKVKRKKERGVSIQEIDSVRLKHQSR